MMHFGRWLLAEINKSGLSREEFASAIGVRSVTLRSWYKRPRMATRSNTVVKLAKLVGTTDDDLLKRFGPEAGSISRMLETGVPLGERGETLAANGRVVEIGKPDPRLIRDVPILNSVAAGPLTDFGDAGYPAVLGDGFVRMAIGDVPAFGLWIVGESMSPRYEHGDLVIFRKFEVGAEPIRNGLDYAVVMGDGDPVSTFKRFELTKDKWIVMGVAINPEFRPRRMRIDLRKVAGIGIAIDIVLGGRRR